MAHSSDKTKLYLLHFESPISPFHTTQHYIGSTKRDIEDRLDEHAKGSGARLTQVAKQLGIGFQLARLWASPKSNRDDERRLKNLKAGPKLCPICAGRRRQVSFLEEIS